MDIKDKPVNEIFAGALALIAFVGTIVLQALHRDIPLALQGLDGAVVLYYFGALSYNIGVAHGVQAFKPPDEKR